MNSLILSRAKAVSYTIRAAALLALHFFIAADYMYFAFVDEAKKNEDDGDAAKRNKNSFVLIDHINQVLMKMERDK